MIGLITISNKNKSITTKPKTVSIEDYYRREEKSIHKNEYHDGIIVPMAGAKLQHNILANRASFELEYYIRLNNLNYLVSNSDTKVRIEKYNKIVYPDAVVICETPQYYNGREDTILNPLIIVEVLSVSTQRYDRSTKFEMYRTIESFKEYVLVYQDRQHVAVWTKQNDGSWLPKDYMGLEATAIIYTLENCPIALNNLYKNITVK